MNRIEFIKPLDGESMKKAQIRWNNVAKPLHSLGLLEKTVIQLAGIIGSDEIDIGKRCVVDMCADNGVVCEGVTQTDSSVTAVVAKAMAEGRSSINRLADRYNADVVPVDIGMNSSVQTEGILQRKIACGTGNIAAGSAMTAEQAKKAIAAGMDIVRDCAEKGYKVIVTGEMGIGNTTTSSALAAVILGEAAADVTGRGAGLDNKGLARKTAVIERAIAVNKPDVSDPVGLLAKLGGFDIAGMAGLFLGGAVYRVPVVIDGFISAVSAAIAALINPLAKDYSVCSHVSKEPAGMKMLDYLEKKPLITAEMCLGEGTGGIMLLPLLDGALEVYNSAHKFDELPMKKYEDFEC